MTKRQTAITVLLSLLLVASCALVIAEEEAAKVWYDMGFHNESDKTMVYHLYWIDHPYADHAGEAVEVAAVELLPNESDVAIRAEGRYYLEWKELPTYKVTASEYFWHYSNTAFIYK